MVLYAYMLIDDVTIRVRAGKGGKGAVAWEKNKLALGPTGARGGNGGSVYMEGVADIGALAQFRHEKEIAAENGEEGGPQYSDGRNGKDVIVRVPVGTVIHTIDAHTEREVVRIGERIRVAEGGLGGKGNFHFRSPENTSPTEFQPGLPGDEFQLRLELKLIADVGFVGLPNVGKSSLLNELTAAKSKVANYPFTTLEPNLGAYYDLIIADIPGLIEGAHAGKGLGIKFLRHVERTSVLFHFISAESETPEDDYRIIKNELAAFNPELAKKNEYLFLSKSDILAPAEIDECLAMLKKCNPTARALSIYDLDSLEHIKGLLNELLAQKHGRAAV